MMNTRTTTACTPIDSDRITVSDLARAIPEFNTAPPEESVGFAPTPGSRRVVHIDQVRRLANKYNVPLHAGHDVCFEWPLIAAAPERVIRAMRESLANPDARIEVVEINHRSVPAGKLIFPRTGLTGPGNSRTGTALWRGYVSYGNDRRFDIWARVRISAPEPCVVALNEIPSGKAIDDTDVKLVTVYGFPQFHAAARTLDQVRGRIARQNISAGQTVLRTGLAEPMFVKTGDIVDVEVDSGAARLKLQARAENSGRDGDMIEVRNPKSGKLFRARVEGKGKVIVLPGPTAGMVN